MPRTGKTAARSIIRRCVRARVAAETHPDAAQQHGADFVVIDTPAKSDSAAIEAARAANLVLIPVWPQIYHYEGLPAPARPFAGGR